MNSENIANFGEFCWAELLAKDIQRSSQFYLNLFGWNQDSMPLNLEENYFFFQLGAVSIAGGMQLSEKMLANKVPAQWYPYILVQDIHETVKSAVALGATVMKDVSDVTTRGKMAVLLDPTGAVFNLWQATGESSGYVVSKNTVGQVGWYELVTQDTDKAGKFYTELFNWSLRNIKLYPGRVYNTFLQQNKSIAGMLSPRSGDKGDSRWNIYFVIKNIQDFIRRAQELGAVVCYDPLTVRDVGTFSMLRDPDGTFFSVIEWS